MSTRIKKYRRGGAYLHHHVSHLLFPKFARLLPRLLLFRRARFNRVLRVRVPATRIRVSGLEGDHVYTYKGKFVCQAFTELDPYLLAKTLATLEELVDGRVTEVFLRTDIPQSPPCATSRGVNKLC